MPLLFILPIIFFVDGTLPIQEEIQNIIFPIVLGCCFIYAVFRQKIGCETCRYVPFWVWFISSIFLAWNIACLDLNLYNSSTSLLLLGSMGLFICLDFNKNYVFAPLVLTTILIQGIAWLEVLGIRLYGEKTISAVTSIFNQKNHFQLFSLPLSFATALFLWDWRGRVGQALGAMIVLSGFVLCYLADSDAGVASLATVFLVVAYFRGVKNPWLHIVPLVCLLLWILLPWFCVSLIPYVSGNASALSRIAIWNSTTNAIIEAPWFGYGIGSFQTVIRDFSTLNPSLTNYVENGFIGGAHNQYLNTWLELGFAGFALEMAFVIGALVGFWRLARNGKLSDWLWFGILLYVALFISITIPTQVFFSARLGYWLAFVLAWIHIGKHMKMKLVPSRLLFIMGSVSLLLILFSWQGERLRIESQRTMATEIISGKVDQTRLYVIPKALSIDSRNPFALWFMANGLYSAGEYVACLQVLDRMDSTSGHFFNTAQFRKKCSH